MTSLTLLDVEDSQRNAAVDHRWLLAADVVEALLRARLLLNREVVAGFVAIVYFLVSNFFGAVLVEDLADRQLGVDAQLVLAVILVVAGLVARSAVGEGV